MREEKPGAPGWLNRIGTILEMIKIQHTIFALPFAVMSARLATVVRGSTPWGVYFWILVAMVSARSAAMAFNRLVDLPFDKENPRTSARALPLGLVSPVQVGIFTGVSTLLFMLAASKLNTLAFALSPVALAIILGYSYTKRFTWLSHWVLGVALGIAPVGAWIAVAGSIALPPVLLAGAVMLWTAGFDIIYACQDTEFDQETGLHSVPQRFGVPMALQLSSLLHGLVVMVLAALGAAAGLGWIYDVGVLLTAGLLIYEHRLVRPGDLSRVNAAFFTTNGLVSVGLMLFLLLDLAWR